MRIEHCLSVCKCMAETCIFCKIARKETEASIIYENADVIAFMDIRPVSEGHTLIIPKKHYVDIFDIPENFLKQPTTSPKKSRSPLKKQPKPTESASSSRMEQRRDRKSSICRCMLFRGLRAKRCQGSKNWG